jgi:UDP-glucose 4-epimerase/UDP-glucuronate decarboxylase
MPKRILLTGGAGFIGYHLSRVLLSASGDAVQVVIADNFQRGKKDDDFASLAPDPRVTVLDLDLTDPASYARLGRGYDHVYHLAAVNGTKTFYQAPQEVLRINTLTLVYLLEWFRKENAEGKLCFTSSNEAYAGGLIAFGRLPIPTPEQVPLVIEDPYNPRWSYAATKLVGELFVIHYAQSYRLRAVIVRPHNFYGPRAGYDHVIPEFALRIARRTDPFPIFGAEETRTFCFIEDAVRAMRLLMESSATDGQPIETVHIGDDLEITMAELAERMFRVAGWKPSQVEVQPSPPGSVRRRRGDASKLRRLTGWQPEIPLDEGLKRTYEWYRAHPAPRA